MSLHELLTALDRGETWRAMAAVMSDVSEETWCASWMRDCEYDIYQLMTEGGTWGFGSAESLEAELDFLRAKMEETGVWVEWGPDGTQPIPLNDWMPKYQQWSERRAREKIAWKEKQRFCKHGVPDVIFGDKRCGECLVWLDGSDNGGDREGL